MNDPYENEGLFYIITRLDVGKFGSEAWGMLPHKDYSVKFKLYSINTGVVKSFTIKH